MLSARNPVRQGVLWLVAAALLVPTALLLKGVSADIYVSAVELDIGPGKRITEIALLGLIAVFALAAWGFRKLNIERIATAVTAGLGIILAYVLSEVIKLFLTQERPCRTEVMLDNCPVAGDWSFPSNHATIAFAVATGIVIILASRWALLAYLGAAIVGVLRVLDGAHYPHDVLAGAILGVCVTIGVFLVLLPLQRAVCLRLADRK